MAGGDGDAGRNAAHGGGVAVEGDDVADDDMAHSMVAMGLWAREQDVGGRGGVVEEKEAPWYMVLSHKDCSDPREEGVVWLDVPAAALVGVAVLAMVVS